jgi:hypothetical protein
MSINNIVNTYIDTLGIRCECDNKKQREGLFNALIDFLLERKSVGIRYNKERSTEHYQITDLLYGNSKLASIERGYYKNKYNRLNPDNYYLNINFYGLKRYNNKKDEASFFLIRTITAFLNTYNVDFKLTELDIALDIKTKIDNILAVCVSRSPNVSYYQLGDIDADGNTIQNDKGTYYIEKLSDKQKKNAMNRVYLYDKRKKESDKFKRDIGFDLTRFEVKLQTRFFAKKTFEPNSIYKALAKYNVLYFTDKNQKQQLIKKLNNTRNARQRKKIISTALKHNRSITRLTTQMNIIGNFLREIDTIKLNKKGGFIFTKHEDYLEFNSKFYSKPQ